MKKIFSAVIMCVLIGITSYSASADVEFDMHKSPITYFAGNNASRLELGRSKSYADDGVKTKYYLPDFCSGLNVESGGTEGTKNFESWKSYSFSDETLNTKDYNGYETYERNSFYTGNLASLSETAVAGLSEKAFAPFPFILEINTQNTGYEGRRSLFAIDSKSGKKALKINYAPRWKGAKTNIRTDIIPADSKGNEIAVPSAFKSFEFETVVLIHKVMSSDGFDETHLGGFRIVAKNGGAEKILFEAPGKFDTDVYYHLKINGSVLNSDEKISVMSNSASGDDIKDSDEYGSFINGEFTDTKLIDDTVFSGKDTVIYIESFDDRSEDNGYTSNAVSALTVIDMKFNAVEGERQSEYNTYETEKGIFYIDKNFTDKNYKGIVSVKYAGKNGFYAKPAVIKYKKDGSFSGVVSAKTDTVSFMVDDDTDSIKVLAVESLENLKPQDNAVKFKRVGVPDICSFYNDKDGAVSFTFDDSNYQAASFYDSLFEKYNLRGTAMLVSGWLSSYDWEGLFSRGRIDAGNHSVSHQLKYDESVPEDEIDSDINGAWSALSNRFKGMDIITFAYPWGRVNDITDRTVAKHHYAGRIAGGYLAPKNPANEQAWMRLPCYTVLTQTTADQLNKAADDAAEQKKWLIELWHGTAEDDDMSEGHNIKKGVCDTHLKHIADLNDKLWCGTFTQVTKYIREKQNSSVNIISADDKCIKLSFETTLNSSIFNFPLTVKFELPDGFENALITKKGEILESFTKTEEGKKYVYFNTVPNAGVVLIEK